MLKYILKRLIFALLTVFIVVSILFVLIHVKHESNWIYGTFIPNDSFLYKDPLPVQFFNYWKGIITRFDFGVCTTRGPLYMYVTKYMAMKLPVTLLLNAGAILVSFLGIPLGILAACNKNKWPDYVINVLAMIFFSIPLIVAGFLFQYVFGYILQIFPVTYPHSVGLFSRESITGLIPAMLALGMAPAGIYIRSMYSGLTETLTSDHMLLAKVKGLNRKQTIIRHGIRNSFIAVLPDMYANTAFVVLNTIIIELIFAIPGAGVAYLRSYFYGDYINMVDPFLIPDGIPAWIWEILETPVDYDVFLGFSFFFVSYAIILGFLLDISYCIIDPRIRIGANKNNTY